MKVDLKKNSDVTVCILNKFGLPQKVMEYSWDKKEISKK